MNDKKKRNADRRNDTSLNGLFRAQERSRLWRQSFSFRFCSFSHPVPFNRQLFPLAVNERSCHLSRDRATKESRIEIPRRFSSISSRSYRRCVMFISLFLIILSSVVFPLLMLKILRTVRQFQFNSKFSRIASSIVDKQRRRSF